MFFKLFWILLSTSVMLFANGYMEFVREEETSLWVSLFALAIVSILFLYIASEQLREVNKKHKLILATEKAIERKQQFILEFMGKKIETSTNGIVESRTKLEENDFNEMSPTLFKQEIEKFKESEEVLLDATHELIDFLKLKSGTLVLKEESYKLNNIMSETFASIHNRVKEQKTEIIYDISTDISTELIGDSKRMEQVLRTVLQEALIGVRTGMVKVSMNLTSKNEQIKIDIHHPDKYIPKEHIAVLLEDYTLKEEYKSKEKLYMYVTYKLILQMGGTFEIVSNTKEGTHYIIKLPYVPKNKNSINNTIRYPKKRVLVAVEEKMLANIIETKFKEKDIIVEYVNKEKLAKNLIKLTQCHIFMIDKSLLSENIIKKIEELEENKKPAIVVLQNIYDNGNISHTNYITLGKPFNNIQIDSMLSKIFSKKELINDEIKDKNIEENHKHDIKILRETPSITRESFYQFSHLHILIVEDNSMNQKILQGVFSLSNMTISLAGNGQEALEIIRNNSEIDLIFMDTNMPVMDGYEATKRIRTFRSMKMLPIIALESVGFDCDDMDGINAVLQKPFKIGQLYTALITYTSEKQSTVKHVVNKLTKYKDNKHVLDIQKGIFHANTAVFYKEVLKETFIILDKSDEQLKTYIMQIQYKEVKLFVLETIRLSEIIGAIGLRKILIEIMQIFDYSEENRLQDYIPLYKKELKLLKSEIKEYLKT